MLQPARILLFTLGVTLPVAALAQPEAATDASRAYAALESSLSRGIMSLDVDVTDEAGHFVSGLKPEDFTLFDNGLPQRIVSFQASQENPVQPDQAVETILVVDSLNLSAQQLSDAKIELAKFLREHNGRPSCPVMLYWLTGFGLSTIPQPSMNGNELASTVMQTTGAKTLWTVPVHPEGAPRAELDHARNEESLKALGSIAIQERKRPGRKRLLWVGPGWPAESAGNYSFQEIVELSTRLREARISLFTVTAWAYPNREFTYEEYLKAVKSEKDARPGDMSLEVLATKSGGRVTEPSFDLRGTIERCVEHANSFYTVSFDPPRTDHPDEYHELKVIVSRSDLSARTNFEYYDQPTYYDHPAAVQLVTVEQLESGLRGHRGQSDAELAGYLSTLQLTERLDGKSLADAISSMRGKKSRDALVPLVDKSLFLPQPAQEMPQLPAPDSNEQNAVLHLLQQYLTQVVPNLPNFYAIRVTDRFAEPKQKDELAWKTVPADQSLHPFGADRVTVRISNSREMTENVSGRKASDARERSLITEGTFGPILSLVSNHVASPSGKLEWSRWESWGGRTVAVFRFAVRDHASDFEVGFCCLAESDGTLPYKRKTPYHGELTIDPLSGALLRIWVQADLPARLPMNFSALAVDYAPIPIGGKSYLCPVKSVSISRSRTVKMLNEWDQNFGVYGPFQTLLNDASFTNYHIFRSGHRILTDFSAEP